MALKKKKAVTRRRKEEGEEPDKPLFTPGPAIKVRALETGYYGDARRRPGDVFNLVDRWGTWTKPILDDEGDQKYHPITKEPLTEQVEGVLTAEDQFSEKWMERADDDEPLHTSSGREVLKKEHDDVLAVKMGRANRPTGSANVLGDD